MNIHEDGPAPTREQLTELMKKSERLAAVLRAFWAAHPDQLPKSTAEGITRANELYAQLYPNECAYGETCPCMTERKSAS